MDSVNLTDNFLIAMPTMSDPYFGGALVYVCQHTSEGAMGVIVNRPIDMNLGTFFNRVDLPLEQADLAEQPIYFGGPVQLDRGFVLHRPVGEWQSTLPVLGGELGLTSSRDVLASMGSLGVPRDALITLGYSGWGAGQLEAEIGQNAWLSVPASHGILFDLPAEARLPAAMQPLGITYAQLSEVAGHA